MLSITQQAVVLQSCEDLEDLESLRLFFEIIKYTIMLSESRVMNLLFKEENVMDVVSKSVSASSFMYLSASDRLWGFDCWRLGQYLLPAMKGFRIVYQQICQAWGADMQSTLHCKLSTSRYLDIVINAPKNSPCRLVLWSMTQKYLASSGTENSWETWSSSRRSYPSKRLSSGLKYTRPTAWVT